MTLEIKSIKRGEKPRDTHNVLITTDNKLHDCPAIDRWSSRHANNDIYRRDGVEGEILFVFREWRDVQNFEKWIEKGCPHN